MSKTVEEICGPYPEGYVKEDIASDPNFVFNNDPEYSGVNVYDEIGNSVTVNSFQECEHYVMGGWYNNPTSSSRLEEDLQIGIVYFLIAALVIKFIIKKFVKT
tara:strand:+ start:912 stop:1220 length:309 start_codon:yes stop_codon:yes gene_type:complete